MDSNQIEELLARYWNCETSLEEEQQLREYFQHADIPERLKETGALFQYFELQKKKSLSDSGFDGLVLDNVVRTKKTKTISWVYNSMRIAAGVGVLMVAIWFVRTEIHKSDPVVEDTYDDPKLAFEETKKALLMISKSFGKAEEQAKKINLFNEAQDEIKKKEKERKM